MKGSSLAGGGGSGEVSSRLLWQSRGEMMVALTRVVEVEMVGIVRFWIFSESKNRLSCQTKDGIQQKKKSHKGWLCFNLKGWIELPPTEMEKATSAGVWGRNIRNVILDMLSLRWALNIQVGNVKWAIGYIRVWSSREKSGRYRFGNCRPRDVISRSTELDELSITKGLSICPQRRGWWTEPCGTLSMRDQEANYCISRTDKCC